MTRLSNRQHTLFRIFVDGGNHFFLSIEQAQTIDQRPFGSLLHHEWVRYRSGHGFFLTKEGWQAWREFQETEIWRKNPNLPLTRLFDPDAYRLRVVRGAA